MSTQHLRFGAAATLIRSSIFPTDYTDEAHTLLSRLISGQLLIQEAAAIIEEPCV